MMSSRTQFLFLFLLPHPECSGILSHRPWLPAAAADTTFSTTMSRGRKPFPEEPHSAPPRVIPESVMARVMEAALLAYSNHSAMSLGCEGL